MITFPQNLAHRVAIVTNWVDTVATDTALIGVALAVIVYTQAAHTDMAFTGTIRIFSTLGTGF
jgi:hypothetical protein